MKVHQPKVKCLIPSPHGHVPADDLACQAPMRLTRCGPGPDNISSFTYGQYFKSIKDVISENDYEQIVNATGRQLSGNISLDEIDEIRIYAEKHGSDYHPARVEVQVNEGCAAFVMNVAVTARGNSWLNREFEVLEYLNGKYDFSYLPGTYFQREAPRDEAPDGVMSMFLADWFQGYHEFHLSIDKTDGSQRMEIWDMEKGRRYLSQPQALQVYGKIAEILTLYYDVETCEQIFPWHRAAGDFIVKAQGESIDVRLVTARQYAPMLERSVDVSIYEALLFFLLNLSVRMRLDRFDGVGKVAWSDDDSVDATMKGFAEGLKIKEQKKYIGAGFVDTFLEHCCSLSKEDLSYRFHLLIDACDQAAPDMPAIRQHLNSHILKFHSSLQCLKD